MKQQSILHDRLVLGNSRAISLGKAGNQTCGSITTCNGCQKSINDSQDQRFNELLEVFSKVCMWWLFSIHRPNLASAAKP